MLDEVSINNATIYCLTNHIPDLSVTVDAWKDLGGVKMQPVAPASA